MINKIIDYRETNKTIETSNGVMRIKAQGIVTNDRGVKTNQTINIFKKENNNNNIKMINWSLFENGKVSLASTLDVAKDFEANNLDYKVIAGINGDYFAYENEQVINSSVVFNNKVIKADNHFKYSSIEFDLEGSFIKKHKIMDISKDLTLCIYNSFNEIIYKKDDVNYNELSSKQSDTIIYDKTFEDNLKDFKKVYNIEIINSYIHNPTFYIEGIVSNDKSEDLKYKLATNDTNLIKTLELNRCIKLQREINNKPKENMIIGIDSQFLVDGTIPSYEDIGGQNLAHTSDRHPRSAFCYDSTGNVYLTTVDGRTRTSDGVGLREFGKILKYYGMNNAFNLDGGGSTQAIFRVNDELKIVNEPSDDELRKIGNVLLFITKR